MKEQHRPATGRVIHTLVVDDSAVMRRFMTALLSSEPDMSVQTAADPLIAMEKMRHRHPDVMLLDLEMPRMDGLTFLAQIMKERPTPVVVCSGFAGRGTELAFKALERGAVEVLAKPQLGLTEFLRESAVLLVDTIRAASLARLELPTEAAAVDGAPPLPRGPSQARGRPRRLVAVGASTGGTEAIQRLLVDLPVDAPPILIAQHMPAKFTAAFARRLDALCRVRVSEARNGDSVETGEVWIAPGDRHMELVLSGESYAVRVRTGPLVSRHRPSVDVLFRSVARVAVEAGTGVILTGMGDDGARGLLEMKQAGAFTIAQDEATSVIFGMPREAIARGAVDAVMPLTEIASAILGHRLHGRDPFRARAGTA